MASLGMTLLDLLNKSEQGADPNFLRDGGQLLAQELMDAAMELAANRQSEPSTELKGRRSSRAVQPWGQVGEFK